VKPSVIKFPRHQISILQV